MNEKQQKPTIFKNLTPQQSEACIMLAGGESITKVSKKLKINRSTIYQWLKDYDFKKCFDKQCEENQEEIKTMLRGLRLKAVETINGLVSKGDEKTRLKAAIWILESNLTESTDKMQPKGLTIIVQNEEEADLFRRLEERANEENKKNRFDDDDY